MNFIAHVPGASRNMSDLGANQTMNPTATQAVHHQNVQVPTHQMHHSQQTHQTPVPLPQMQHYSSPSVSRTIQFQNSTHGSFVQSYQQAPMHPGVHTQNFQQVPQGYGTAHHPRPQAGGQAQVPHQVNAYNPPRPPEVYTLPDTMNDALPDSVRATFQHDSNGRVLFFTAPPLERADDGVAPIDTSLGHSAKYLSGRKDWLRKRAMRKSARADAVNKLPLQHPSRPSNMTVTNFQPQAKLALTQWFQNMNKETQTWRNEAGL